MELKKHSTPKNTYKQGFLDGKMDAKLEIAKKMLVNGLTLESVRNLTGLTQNEINTLAK